MQGHAAIDQQAQKEEDLMRAQIELEERRAEQAKLNQQLREKEDLAQAAEEKYASISEVRKPGGDGLGDSSLGRLRAVADCDPLARRSARLRPRS